MSIPTLSSDRDRSLDAAKGLSSSPKNIERVGNQVGVEAARWAFNQWELRERARNKFARADEMLFTRNGLEMASHEVVAMFHAFLFERKRIWDLTCGIGSDLIAFARAADEFMDVPPPIGLDTEGEHVLCAQHNLKVHGLRGRAILYDSTRFGDRAKDAGVFFDPQRRTHSGRTLNPGDFSPDIPTVLRHVGNAAEIAIKLSPMLSDEYLASLGGRTWFVSHNRQCCEALVLKNGLENFGRGGACHAETKEFLDTVALSECLDDPLAYVHEADPAAVRGHCLGAFKMPGLGDSNGYLTSTEPGKESVWFRSYRVHWSGPWRIDPVRKVAAQLNLKVEAVKCRGVDADVQAIKKALGPGGVLPAVLILYPVGRKRVAILAEPLERPPTA